MAWTAPRTWVVGEIVTAALLNTHLRDNLNYLFKNVIQITDVLNVAPANVVFSSIPQTFSHLLLVMHLRGNGTSTATTVVARLNNDSGAVYEYGGSAAGAAQTQWVIGDMVGSASDSQFDTTVFVLPNYTTTNRKSFYSFSGGYTVAGGGSHARSYGGRYTGAAAAVTRIDVLGTGISLDTGSKLTLYGMS